MTIEHGAALIYTVTLALSSVTTFKKTKWKRACAYLSPVTPITKEDFCLTYPGSKPDFLKVYLKAYLTVYSPFFLSGMMHFLGHYIFDEACGSFMYKEHLCCLLSRHMSQDISLGERKTSLFSETIATGSNPTL